MSKVQSSIYRGFPIIARWAELKRSASGYRRFTASYAIHLAGPEAALWHKIPLEFVFVSFRTALAYAVYKAQAEIDGNTAEAHFPGSPQ